MAKQSGLGDQLFVGGYDIGADVSVISGLSTPRATLPSTGITVSANERMYGQRDASAEFNTFFNKATGQQHLALRGLPTANVDVMYLRGSGIGNEAFCITGKQVNYDPTRGDDGSLTFGISVPAAAYGADWCDQLTAGKQTDASATDSTGLDTTASKSFGFQAYLQVFSLGSGTATVTIEDSADDVTYAAVTSGAFTDVTGQTTERIQSASDTQTVRRYVRVSTTGTFTDLVFAVAINKNQAARAI